mmetsp:Transcript_37599/g.75773  ORF Transcript_37599/g.75773 Transcript_37599/m.75773 type:complete len:281 (+) Transcript_37599:600-1442(+)
MLSVLGVRLRRRLQRAHVLGHAPVRICPLADQQPNSHALRDFHKQGVVEGRPPGRILQEGGVGRGDVVHGGQADVLAGRQDRLHQSVPVPSPAREGPPALRVDRVGRVAHFGGAAGEERAAEGAVQDERHGVGQVVDCTGRRVEGALASRAATARTAAAKLAEARHEAFMLQVRVEDLHPQVREGALEGGVGPRPPAVEVQLEVLHRLESWRALQCYAHLLHLGEASPVCIGTCYHCTVAVEDPELHVHHSELVPFAGIPQSEGHLVRILPLQRLQLLYA